MSNALSYTEAELLANIKARELEIQNGFRNNFLSEGGLWRLCQWWDDKFFTDDKFKLKELSQILEDIILHDKYKQDIIISVMPRFGKSYLTTMACILQYIKNASSTIMRNTCNDTLAKTFSGHVIDIINSPKFKEIFPTIKLSKTKKEITNWKLEGSYEYSYLCSGIGGGIQGKGVKTLAILDDPIKDNNEANSPIILDKIYNWYLDVHRKRKDPNSNCREIIIGTRWNENDVIGRLLRDMPDKFKTFIFPALDENNKSFCEAIISTQKLLEERELYKKNGTLHSFDALYNCNPYSPESILIEEDRLNRFKKSELLGQSIDAKYIVCDFADTGRDYLSAPVGYVIGDNCYVVDVLYDNSSTELTEPRIVELINKHIPQKVIIESNAGGRQFAINVSKKINTNLTMIDAIPNTSNKETRILVRIPIIINNFHFLIDSEQSDMYKLFFYHFIKYRKGLKNQQDDAIDSLSMLCDVSYCYDTLQIF